MIDAYVTGRSLPALFVALELAEVGLRVRVALDGDERLPATPLRDPEGALTGLMERLAQPIAEGGAPHPGLSPRRQAPAPVAVPTRNGRWALQPEPAVLGIPAVPLSERSLAILGSAAGTRAYLDRVKPLLTIGKTRGLGALVRSRLGRVACERLVEPVVRERFGVGVDGVEVAVAAPGLNEAMTRAGSLSGAVLACSERNVARETRVEPLAGWAELRTSLVDRLSLYGVEFADAGLHSASRGETRWRIEEEDGSSFEARAVILDCALAGESLPVGVEADPYGGRRRVRVVARASVQPPTWWTSGERSADVTREAAGTASAEGDAVALRTVTLGSGEVWSVRVGAERGTAWTAEMRGPATSFDDAGSAGVGDVVAEAGGVCAAAARAALDAAELTASSEIRCALEAAPHTTVAERETAELRLQESQRIADPGLLPVGEALLGGDLSAALHAAAEPAIALRRHLTGIAE